MPRKPKLTYVIAQDILLSSPYSVFSFDEHTVVVPIETIEFLTKIKNGRNSDSRRNAVEVLRILEELVDDTIVVDEKIQIPNGGHLYISSGFKHMNAMADRLKLLYSEESYRREPAIGAALEFIYGSGNSTPQNQDTVIIVSNEVDVRVKAQAMGIHAEKYRSDQAVALKDQYTGRKELYISDADMQKFYGEGGRTLLMPQNIPVTEHEFFLLRNETNPNQSALASYHNGYLCGLQSLDEKPYGVIPRNVGQKFAIEALLRPADEAPLVILKGPAGTAKTFLSLACALQQTLNDKLYSQILVVRPNQKMDDDIGFLKGDEQAKIGPLLRGVTDNLNQLTKMKGARRKDGIELPSSYANDLFSSGVVTAQALAYMRGRSVTDTFIIIDEVQNTTPLQIFSVISRAGTGSKIVLAGDPEQIDVPTLDAQNNGLSYASERMKGSPYCWQMTFNNEECVRSNLAMECIKRMAPKGRLQ